MITKTGWTDWLLRVPASIGVLVLVITGTGLGGFGTFELLTAFLPKIHVGVSGVIGVAVALTLIGPLGMMANRAIEWIWDVTRKPHKEKQASQIKSKSGEKAKSDGETKGKEQADG